jgi:hypothetical protein
MKITKSIIEYRMRHWRDKTSFTEKSSLIERLLGLHKVPPGEVRQIWLKGIEEGIKDGISVSAGIKTLTDYPGAYRKGRSRLQDDFMIKYRRLCESHRMEIVFTPEGLELMHYEVS